LSDQKLYGKAAALMNLLLKPVNSIPDSVRPPAGWLYKSAVVLLKVPMTLLLGIRIKRSPELKRLSGSTIVLGNHPSYLDPFIAALALPHMKINFVAASSFFRRRFLGWVLRTAGVIPKIQFRSDARALKQMLQVLHNKGVLGIFPEGQRSLDGCPQTIDDTIARLIKKTGSHVVVVRISGAYLTWPRWSESKFRPGRIEVETRLLIDGDAVRKAGVEEITRLIRGNLDYDEYKWQNGLPRKAAFRSLAPAKGLHKICHQCPCCHKIMTMKSERRRIFCSKCNSSFNYDKYGFIAPSASNGNIDKSAECCPTDKTFPATVHDWHIWQQKMLTHTMTAENFILDINVKTEAADETGEFKEYGEGSLCLDHNGLIYNGVNPDGKTFSYVFPVNRKPQFSADYGSRIEIAHDSGFWRFYPVEGQAVMLLADALEILDKKRQD
jgi:1-acyl-sn-glycerol-3-phosphate acyltransferase